MKEKIEKTVKFGVPILVVLMMLFIQFFASGGDAEFGSIGNDGGLALLLVAFIILYFIAGIIVWAVSKNNFIFLSAIFSIGIIIFYIMIFVVIAQYQTVQKDINYAEYKKNAPIRNQRKYDSLTVIIEKSDNDYEAREERALLFYYKMADAYTPEEEIEKHINDLEYSVKNNTSNYYVYRVLAGYYNSNNEFEKSIEMCENALLTLEFSSNNRIMLEQEIVFARDKRKEQNYDDETNRKWKEKEIELKKRWIKYYTKELAKDSLNLTYLAKRGVAYGFIGKEKEALADFDKVLKIKPEYMAVLISKAEMYYSLGKYTEAITAYERCKEVDSQFKANYQAQIDKIKQEQKND